MATTKTVDLLTIGAGGGATAAAFRLARAGREVGNGGHQGSNERQLPC